MNNFRGDLPDIFANFGQKNCTVLYCTWQGILLDTLHVLLVMIPDYEVKRFSSPTEDKKDAISLNNTAHVQLHVFILTDFFILLPSLQMLACR